MSELLRLSKRRGCQNHATDAILEAKAAVAEADSALRHTATTRKAFSGRGAKKIATASPIGASVEIRNTATIVVATFTAVSIETISVQKT